MDNAMMRKYEEARVAKAKDEARWDIKHLSHTKRQVLIEDIKDELREVNSQLRSVVSRANSVRVQEIDFGPKRGALRHMHTFKGLNGGDTKVRPMPGFAEPIKHLQKEWNSLWLQRKKLAAKLEVLDHE